MTPSQFEFHQAHLARRARMEGRAFVPRVAPRAAVAPPAVPKLVEPKSEYQPWFCIVSATGEPMIRDIQKAVAEFYGCTLIDLKSHRRTYPIVRYRQIAMAIAKQMTERSLPEIGRAFGGRDHTTVLHAVRKIDRLSASDTKLADEINQIKQRIEESHAVTRANLQSEARLRGSADPLAPQGSEASGARVPDAEAVEA